MNKCKRPINDVRPLCLMLDHKNTSNGSYISFSVLYLGGHFKKEVRLIRMHMDGSSWTSMIRLNDSRSHERPLNETRERQILVYFDSFAHIYSIDANAFSLAGKLFLSDIEEKTSLGGLLIGRNLMMDVFAWIPRSVRLDVV